MFWWCWYDVVMLWWCCGDVVLLLLCCGYVVVMLLWCCGDVVLLLLCCGYVVGMMLWYSDVVAMFLQYRCNYSSKEKATVFIIFTQKTICSFAVTAHDWNDSFDAFLQHSLTSLTLFQVGNAYLQRDLFSLEKQERAMNLKFGVIYAKSGQITDDEVSQPHWLQPA